MKTRTETTRLRCNTCGKRTDQRRTVSGRLRPDNKHPNDPAYLRQDVTTECLVCGRRSQMVMYPNLLANFFST